MLIRLHLLLIIFISSNSLIFDLFGSGNKLKFKRNQAGWREENWAGYYGLYGAMNVQPFIHDVSVSAYALEWRDTYDWHFIGPIVDSEQVQEGYFYHPPRIEFDSKGNYPHAIVLARLNSGDGSKGVTVFYGVEDIRSDQGIISVPYEELSRGAYVAVVLRPLQEQIDAYESEGQEMPSFTLPASLKSKRTVQMSAIVSAMAAEIAGALFFRVIETVDYPFREPKMTWRKKWTKNRPKFKLSDKTPLQLQQEDELASESASDESET